MRLIPTKFIKDDAVLADDIYTSDGRTLLRKGTKLSPNLIEKINQNNVFSVYINDVHSNSEIHQLVSPVLRLRGYNLVKETFEAVNSKNQKNNKNDLVTLSAELSKLMDEIIYEMHSVKEKQLEYIDIKNVKSYLYSSALNTALLAVLIGEEMGLSPDLIKNLFMGGIFHDIGMAWIPDEVLYKTEPLSLEDKKYIIDHPTLGHSFLKGNSFLSSYVKAISLQHHENLDGSGYPSRLKGEEVHILSQIVGIADVYDAMTSDRPYRAALSASDAVEYIMANAGSKFNIEIVNAFIKKINPFPVGSLVKMNTGQIAVVDEVSPSLPLRPVVRIISEFNGIFKYERVDLLNNNSLIISGIHY